MRTRSELKERVQSRNKNFTNLEGNAADCVDCTYLIHRHAKNREAGNLVPRHFWKKIRNFFRIQRFLDILSEIGFILNKQEPA